MPGVSPPATTSKAATAAGVGGAGVAIYLIDRLLADDGQVAATMLTRLSPLLGPVWASWPMLVILGLIAWIGYDKWSAAQHSHALEVAASQASATALAASVGDVATGLGGLRREVHELRGALQDHAAATDERMRHHESGLAEVRSEVGQVRTRVDVLELGPRAQPRPRARRPS